MKLFSYLTLSAIASSVLAAQDDPLEKHTIKAKGIEASFIGYGARLTNLIVKDKDGEDQDVVVGYDTGEEYVQDTFGDHTFFGAVVGRYANRITNGTFTIDGKKSHIPTNEHDGANTLHGGNIGYDQRNWTISAQNDSSITFTFLDKGYEGFPGSVITHATYSVKGGEDCDGGNENPKLTTRLVSVPLDEPTPIMLSNHIYWNLGAFTGDDIRVLDDVLHMPYADRYIKVDTILDPTGELGSVKDTVLDFTKPKAIGKDIEKAVDTCGLGCTGYDNAFILDRPRHSGVEETSLPQLSLHSKKTGIKMDVRTNQGGLQIYTCDGQDGTIDVKKSQQHGGGKNGTTTVEQYGCIVIEPQDWVDGINHPEWGRQEYQVYTVDSEPAVNFATYEFSLM